MALLERKGWYFEDFELGQEIVTASRTVTEADVVIFAGLTGDYNPLHTDEEKAKKGPFKTRIAHGYLGLTIGMGLKNQTGIFEGTTMAYMGLNSLRFTGALFFGDTIRVKMKVTDKKETKKEDRGIVILDFFLINQKDETIAEGQENILMARKIGG